ncbi:MAG: hypothetical protein ACT6QS_12320 [Flavobacteriales bacterium]
MKKPLVKIIVSLLLLSLHIFLFIWLYFEGEESLDTQKGVWMGFVLFVTVLLSVTSLLYYSSYHSAVNTGLLIGASLQILIASLMKILHWKGAALILGLAVALVSVIYMVRFIQKKPKKPIDVLKLVFVLSLAFQNSPWIHFVNPLGLWMRLPYGLLPVIILWQLVEGIKEKRTSTGEMRSSID